MEINGTSVRLASSPEYFRNAVRRIRLERGLTQVEVAAKAGVSRRWLSRFETGEDPDGVELYKALAVARAVGFTLTLTEDDQR